MKMWEWAKLFGKSNIKKKQQKKYTIKINGIEREKAVVLSYTLHSEIYKLLRTYKTPQYDTIYVLRNKKAFNTIGFVLNYDVVICDKNGKVLEVMADKEPGYISKHYKGAYFVYFMVVGSINFYNLKKLDRISLRSEWMEWI